MKRILILIAVLLLPMQVDASGRLVDHILAENPLRTGADFSIIANTAAQEGLFSTTDNYGTTHFFRGTHAGLNNNVVFGGHQWKIIRIDGAGNIRLIYNGTCPNNDCAINGNTGGSATSIQTGPFNNQVNHNRFVGYMFGAATGTFDEQHANVNDSAVKTVVDSWFNTLSQEDRELLVTSSFCTDRTLVNGTGLDVTSTDYGAMPRVETGRAPTLTCSRTEDVLSLNAGLITIDEASMAGGVWRVANTDNFLRTGQIFWTMTPRRVTGNIASEFDIAANGGLDRSDVSANRGIRPVVVLNKEVTFEGTGTLTDPYIITELYEETEEPGENETDEEEAEEGIVNPQTNDINIIFIAITTTLAMLGATHASFHLQKVRLK